jgi:hypothetical protein
VIDDENSWMVGHTQVVGYGAADTSVADKALAKAKATPINDANVRIEVGNSQRFRVLSQSAGRVVKVRPEDRLNVDHSVSKVSHHITAWTSKIL